MAADQSRALLHTYQSFGVFQYCIFFIILTYLKGIATKSACLILRNKEKFENELCLYWFTKTYKQFKMTFGEDHFLTDPIAGLYSTTGENRKL